MTLTFTCIKMQYFLLNRTICIEWNTSILNCNEFIFVLTFCQPSFIQPLSNLHHMMAGVYACVSWCCECCVPSLWFPSCGTDWMQTFWTLWGIPFLSFLCLLRLHENSMFPPPHVESAALLYDLLHGAVCCILGGAGFSCGLEKLRARKRNRETKSLVTYTKINRIDWHVNKEYCLIFLFLR